MVHSTRTLLSEAASQMLAAAGQFFSALITTKPPVEKNSEGLWGKRWGVKEKGSEGPRRGEITAFEKSTESYFPVDFIYGGLHFILNNYLLCFLNKLV